MAGRVAGGPARLDAAALAGRAARWSVAALVCARRRGVRCDPGPPRAAPAGRLAGRYRPQTPSRANGAAALSRRRWFGRPCPRDRSGAVEPGDAIAIGDAQAKAWAYVRGVLVPPYVGPSFSSGQTP